MPYAESQAACEAFRVEFATRYRKVAPSAVERLADDWEQRYAVRPVLVETFVDPSRFEGTCYKAANWVTAGQTAGRRDGVRKNILLYALRADWREILGAEPARAGLGQSMHKDSPSNWAQEEFGRVRLHDERLKERLYRISEDFYGCMEGSIPQACGGDKARTMGAYRFFQKSILAGKL